MSPVAGGVDDEYRQAMLDQGKSLLQVTPTRWGPSSAGGFPARLT